MILLIDNYDSFVYNLARYVDELGYTYRVVRNNHITLAEIKTLAPSHIIISPGPCTPDEAGICLSLIKTFAATTPILGVCLGHQAIGQAYGGKVVTAKHPMHGKASLIKHDEQGIFKGLPNPLKVARYHSLAVSQAQIPEELIVSARSEHGEIMAFRHVEHPVIGVQFHPESVLTQCGHQLIHHFLQGVTSCNMQSAPSESILKTPTTPV